MTPFRIGDKVRSKSVPEAGLGEVIEIVSDGRVKVQYPTWYNICTDDPEELHLVEPNRDAQVAVEGAEPFTHGDVIAGFTDLQVAPGFTIRAPKAETAVIDKLINGGSITSDDINAAMTSILSDEPERVLGNAPPDIKVHIADEAKRIVSGARRAAYGKPEDNFERIARFWQAYFENTGRGAVNITAKDVSPLMRLMKEARLAETPDHLDSFVDLVGYTLTGAEVNGVKSSA